MKVAICIAGALLNLAAVAQTPENAEKPATAACERLAGAAREQCVRDERLRAGQTDPRRELAGSCDALIGPEKEHCLRKGGTVEAGAQSSRGERPLVVNPPR